VAQFLPASALHFPDLGLHLSLAGVIGASLVVSGGWWLNQRAISAQSGTPPSI